MTRTNETGQDPVRQWLQLQQTLAANSDHAGLMRFNAAMGEAAQGPRPLIREIAPPKLFPSILQTEQYVDAIVAQYEAETGKVQNPILSRTRTTRGQLVQEMARANPNAVVQCFVGASALEANGLHPAVHFDQLDMLLRTSQVEVRVIDDEAFSIGDLTSAHILASDRDNTSTIHGFLGKPDVAEANPEELGMLFELFDQADQVARSVEESRVLISGAAIDLLN